MPFETLKSLCTRGITPEYRNDLIAFCSPRPNNWKWASWTYQLFFFKIHQWNCINYSHFFTQKSGYFESEFFFWHQKNPPKCWIMAPQYLVPNTWNYTSVKKEKHTIVPVNTHQDWGMLVLFPDIKVFFCLLVYVHFLMLRDTAYGKAKHFDFRKSLGNSVFLLFFFFFLGCSIEIAGFPFWVASWYYICCHCLRYPDHKQIEKAAINGLFLESSWQ